MPLDRVRSRLVVELALRDFLHERVMSACFVLSLSAVLLPLLVVVELLVVSLGFSPSARAFFKASTNSFFSKKTLVDIP